MWVGAKFEGDDDDALILAQHDAYGQALTVLVGGASRRWCDAEALLDTTTDLGRAIRNDRFDHHVVQDAHDLLAALWRLQRGYLHPQLPGLGPTSAEQIADCLAWLARWVERECSPGQLRALLSVAYEDPAPDHPAEVKLLSELRSQLDRELAASTPACDQS